MMYWMMIALQLLLAPAPSGQESILEKIEAEIISIVSKVRPAVVRVSVERDPRFDFRMGFTAKDPAENRARILFREAQEEARQEQEEREQLIQLRQGLRQDLALDPWANRITGGNVFHRRSIGTGFFIDSNHVITTHAVAGGKGKITVTLDNGNSAQGTLIGSDGEIDIALIKVEGEHAAVALGDSGNCRIGSMGVFVSTSAGDIENIKHGFVTGIDAEGGEDRLRVNFTIEPGESGAPLMNSRGECVGIATANITRNLVSLVPRWVNNDSSLGFTLNTQAEIRTRGTKNSSYFIPSNRIREIVADLKEFGRVRRPYFGVTGTDIVIESENLEGLRLDSVGENTAAERAGLQVGDIIVRVAEKKVDGFGRLVRIIRTLEIDKPVQVKVYREGKWATLDLRPQERPGIESRTKKADDHGMTLVEKSNELAEFLGLGDSPEGKVVTAVQEGSKAAAAGIRRGDLILFEEDKPVRVWRNGETFDIDWE